MLAPQVRAALEALREWVDESGFVQFYKYAVGVELYTQNPHVFAQGSAHRFSLFADYVDGPFDHFALGAALSLNLPVIRDQLDDWQRRIADALLEGGLLREADGALRMGRFQLISVHGLPLLVDARLNFPGDENHEVYFGFDSGMLAYYVDTKRFAPDGPALDLGTGTAFLPLFLSNHTSRVVATDIAPKALELARMNLALNRREDRIELREEPYEATFARGERYKTITFNPPFVPLPQELRAPIFAKGTELDGLGYCRQFFQRFGDLVAPGGAAYVVADLVGDREQPFYAEELRRVAEAQRLCIDVFVDSRNDFIEDTLQFQALGRFLHRENPAVPVEECIRRVEHLQRVELGACSTHLSVIAARHATAIDPYCTVFNRYRNAAFGYLWKKAPPRTA